ncbi:MAG: hypothetical protein C4586_05805 [Anaerolineaceae bacterium]|nr:MAG: hypothetical protein C4586_05805 [Anaerolineaceae bacterium]
MALKKFNPVNDAESFDVPTTKTNRAKEQYVSKHDETDPKREPKVREWTLCSNYSTDHDAMKWFVSRDSEITPEVEKPERVHVIEHSAFEQMKRERDELKVEVERLKSESLEMLSIAGQEHITRTLVQAEKRILCAERDRALAMLEKMAVALEKVKPALQVALDDTGDLYYANVSGDIDEALTPERRKRYLE